MDWSTPEVPQPHKSDGVTSPHLYGPHFFFFVTNPFPLLSLPWKSFSMFSCSPEVFSPLFSHYLFFISICPFSTLCGPLSLSCLVLLLPLPLTHNAGTLMEEREDMGRKPGREIKQRSQVWIVVLGLAKRWGELSGTWKIHQGYLFWSSRLNCLPIRSMGFIKESRPGRRSYVKEKICLGV